ncbi:hypothetical protein AAII07_32375 [Microvirga sp. 0TCS3.31]
MLGWGKKLVLPIAFALDREGSRNGGSDVVEVQQHPITQAFREVAIVIRKNAAPDVLDEGQPMGDELRLVLLDETDGFDYVEDQNCSLRPDGDRKRISGLLADLH